MAPLVSVYMTVKNGDRWVESAVSSIQAQTLNQWELIIVDDGSTDETVTIITDIAKNDSRIGVVPTKGVGRGAALNLALRNCQAEFIANLDADDLSHPKRLETQYACAQAHPQFQLLSSSGVIIEDDAMPKWPTISDVPPVHDVTQELAYHCPINHSTVFARRESFRGVGGYDGNLPSQFDYDMWVRLAAAGCKLGRINQPLGAKRWHSSQSFEAKNHLRYVLNSLRVQARAIGILQSGWKARAYLVARFGWAIVPRQMRLLARQALKRW